MCVCMCAHVCVHAAADPLLLSGLKDVAQRSRPPLLSLSSSFANKQTFQDSILNKIFSPNFILLSNIINRGSMVAQWVLLLSYRKEVVASIPGLKTFCVEFACSPSGGWVLSGFYCVC